MKRLNDPERLVEARRIVRQIEPLLNELKELLSNAGDLSPEEKEKILDMKVEDFFGPKSLGTRRNHFLDAMRFRKIRTVRELTQASKTEILRCQRMGEKTFQLLEDHLASYGLSIEKP